ncbi:MAG: HAD family hydrolase [Ignavibacteriae bacterium HGW-Ignavibacteriae-2]|jgi:putative hydrolase of the HAD superfamily|nr:MAG: HAD family hydrolase [Ignavibacteriae bacterium HGW-Ignavibacteriae-2]
MKTKIKVIGFDADDTLWVNEPFYKETEIQFCEMLSEYQPKNIVSKELFETEMMNLEIYGYGAKGFMLSLIETALRVSDYKVSSQIIEKIIELGKKLLNNPIILLDGVLEVLDELFKREYKLIIATKGDLLDQERKLKKSGIEKYFDHVEIMSGKKETDYKKLLKNLGIKPDRFMMIGNSLKSDIAPVLNLGAYAVHIPYHTTWQHESGASVQPNNKNFFKINRLIELIELLNYEKNN